MSNPDFDPSDSTVAKLLEVSADLEAQAAQLQAQLQEVQEKRNSLTTVISLFTPQDLPATESTSTKPVELQQEETAPPSAISQEEPTTTTTTPARKRPRTSASKKSKGKRGAATATFKESWRPYLQDGFSDSASLPEIVTTVLERNRGEVLSARNIMESIFEEEMPRSDYQKVHHRLLTILSKGVKDDLWVRGNKGEYSIPA